MIKKILNRFEHIAIALQLVKWVLLVLPVSVVAGSLVALFLWLPDKVITIRWNQPWQLFLLLLAGIFIYFLYKKLGKNSDAGNNLIMDEKHVPGGGVPARMAPLVLVTTIITQLFGGSAGREGTAVQIGRSIAGLQNIRRVSAWKIRMLLIRVLGTRVTDAVFALKRQRQLKYLLH